MSHHRKGRLSEDEFDEALTTVFAVLIAIAVVAGLMRCVAVLL
jgi:hypothetical protein